MFFKINVGLKYSDKHWLLCGICLGFEVFDTLFKVCAAFKDDQGFVHRCMDSVVNDWTL